MRILSTLVLRPNRIEESERIWDREIKKSKTTAAEFRGSCFRFFDFPVPNSLGFFDSIWTQYERRQNPHFSELSVRRIVHRCSPTKKKKNSHAEVAEVAEEA